MSGESGSARDVCYQKPDAERVKRRLQITGWSPVVTPAFLPAILRLKALSHSPRESGVPPPELPPRTLKAKLRPLSIRMLLSFNNAGGIVFPCAPVTH